MGEDWAPRESANRCYCCFRPRALCFCKSVPQVANRTPVLILQHAGERFHPFNTARIVDMALRQCVSLSASNARLAGSDLPIMPGAGLLFPHDDARVLDTHFRGPHPGQLVVVDGTWSQAKTLIRDLPQLRELPRYRLQPQQPGRYRIRREPNSHSLSTLEAIVAALRVLDPEITGLDELLGVFHTMVDDQLERSGDRIQWRRKKNRDRPGRGLPRALQKPAGKLVVAYGEALPYRVRARGGRSIPINWVARRLGGGPQFAARIRQDPPLSSDELAPLRLAREDFDDAVTFEEFARAWSGYLRADDVLVAYHHRTIRLLDSLPAPHPRTLILKAVFRKQRNDFHSLEQLLAREGLSQPPPGANRAADRLAMAVALIEHLRKQADLERIGGTR